MDRKFYSLIITSGQDGMPRLTHILSGHLNSVYEDDLPLIPIHAEDDADALRIANEIIEEQNRKIIQYLATHQNQE